VPAPVPPKPTHASRMKSRGGFARVWNALGYTADGLRAAWTHEHAFRQELLACAPFALAAWALPGLSAWVRALLFGSLLLILVVELLNSSIEANTDHITLERHPLAKRAKDMGSAAVFLAIVNAAVIWVCCLWSAYGSALLRWL
jgi:diacylglycerol kinase (ATP)